MMIHENVRRRRTLRWLSKIVLILSLSIVGCEKTETVTNSKPKKKPATTKKKKTSEKPPTEKTDDDLTKSPIQLGTGKKKNKEPATISKKRAIHVGVGQPDKELAEVGINKYESAKILLYTDIPKKQAVVLPQLIDQVYPVWKEYYSKTPINKTKISIFPLTGYIIEDRNLFTKARLLPARIKLFAHGGIEDGRFWMKQQETDYYRRHLMLHEATHCFMTQQENGQPLWYMEGMAEFFAVHRFDTNGKVQFGVMPKRGEQFNGFRRIEIVRQEIKKGRFLSIQEVTELSSDQFIKYNPPYAWSWALCQFLDSHPKHQKRFRKLGQMWIGNQFSEAFEEWMKEEGTQLEAEWLNFAHHVEPGFDITRAAIQFETGKKLKGNSPVSKTIQANRGWQSTGVRVEANRTYHLKAAGQYTLAQSPKPWISEPQGVSIRYFNGQPLGKVVAAIITNSEQPPHLQQGTFANVIPIGREAKLLPKVAGTLYLRINDSFAELSDNTGEVSVLIQLSLPGLK